MKKKVLIIIGLAAIGVAAAFNANIGSRAASLSNLALANIEALASSEDSDDCSGSKPAETCRRFNISYHPHSGEYECVLEGNYVCDLQP